MKPEANARNILSTTRATAKMHEFRVAPEDFIQLPQDPATLFALAVGILGDAAFAITDKGHDSLDAQPTDPMLVSGGWAEGDVSPQEELRFASLFFDAFLDAQLDQSITSEFSLLCASAYYLSGNIGSAAVIARKMEPPPPDLAGGLGRTIHSTLRNDYESIGDGHLYSEFTSEIIRRLAGFFSFQNDASAAVLACDALRRSAYRSGSPRDLLYADIIAALCIHKIRNASRTILPGASGLPAELWKPALAKRHFPIELWPAQRRIASAGILLGRSAVIQMPTSAGKTRATELIIRSAFLSQRASLAVIVAPYRSLCHDIRGDIAIAFSGEPIALDEVSDSYQLDVDLNHIFSEQTVLILTPEKLLYILRRAPELAERIGLVIYDEGHQFEGMARGPNYELLLTSLRMALSPDAQTVLISAVIGNAADIAEWLIRDRAAVVDGQGLLPTTKSIAFASWQDARGRLEYVSPQDPEKREFYVPRIISEVTLAARPRETVARSFPDKTDGGDVGLYLGLHVVNNGSVAIFCGRKDSVVKLCRRIVDIFDRDAPLIKPVTVSDKTEVDRIQMLTEAHLGIDAGATRAAALGVFAHHADTPHGLRLSIEHAMKEGLVKFVICTSTLAQGVNFPLKYLVVTSTRQAGEKILVRDFHNLMGRTGRAGMHTEGSIIFSAPSIYDQRNHFRHRWRWDETKRLLDAGNSEPCSSSILALFDDYVQRRPGAPPIVQEIRPEWLDLAFADRNRIETVVSEAISLQPNINTVEFRRFVEDRARIVQSIAGFLIAHLTFGEDDTEARVKALAANTLAYHLADSNTRQRLITSFLAIARSVMENTSGEQRSIIRRAPLPPRAIADLQAWLIQNVEELTTAAAENRLLGAVMGAILAHSSARSIRSLSDPGIVPRALEAWVAGRSFARAC